MSITMKERISRIAEQADVTPAQVQRIIRALSEDIALDLVAGEIVRIPPMGTFRPALRAARNCLHPRTHEPMIVGELTRVRFSACKAWKDRLNRPKGKRQGSKPAIKASTKTTRRRQRATSVA